MVGFHQHIGGRHVGRVRRSSNLGEIFTASDILTLHEDSDCESWAIGTFAALIDVLTGNDVAVMSPQDFTSIVFELHRQAGLESWVLW